MMYKIFFILLGVMLAVSCFAQESGKDKRADHRQRVDAMMKQDEENVITYRKQTVVGFKLTSDGYGGFFEIGRAKSIKKMLLFQLEITERKNAKEVKQSNPLFPSEPYIYGKENFFYPVKIGVQQQILLGNKSNRNGVSVSTNFGGGIVLGVLRPYKMEVIDNDSDMVTRYVKYNSPDSGLFLTQYQPGPPFSSQVIPGFIGGPDFGQGWNDLSVIPGLYAKAALRFDYGRYNETVSALEVGLTGEYYSKKVPQMAYVPEKQFFLGAYISLMFGSRK
jgi:hypothetical protein